jgi:hypothetical protein
MSSYREALERLRAGNRRFVENLGSARTRRACGASIS